MLYTVVLFDSECDARGFRVKYHFYMIKKETTHRLLPHSLISHCCGSWKYHLKMHTLFFYIYKLSSYGDNPDCWETNLHNKTYMHMYIIYIIECTMYPKCLFLSAHVVKKLQYVFIGNLPCMAGTAYLFKWHNSIVWDLHRTLNAFNSMFIFHVPDITSIIAYIFIN